jgi:hypothetical protein
MNWKIKTSSQQKINGMGGEHKFGSFADLISSPKLLFRLLKRINL